MNIINVHCNLYTSSSAALWWASTAWLGGFDRTPRTSPGYRPGNYKLLAELTTLVTNISFNSITCIIIVYGMLLNDQHKQVPGTQQRIHLLSLILNFQHTQYLFMKKWKLVAEPSEKRELSIKS